MKSKITCLLLVIFAALSGAAQVLGPNGKILYTKTVGSSSVLGSGDIPTNSKAVLSIDVTGTVTKSINIHLADGTIVSGPFKDSLGTSNSSDSVVLDSHPEHGKRVGNCIVNIIDRWTGDPVVYKKITNWLDGRIMSDKYLFGSLWIKVGNEYFQRNCDLADINVLWLGLDNTGTTYNQTLLANFLTKLPVSYTLRLKFPNGLYKFGDLGNQYSFFARHTAIGLQDLNITIEGSGGTAFQIDKGICGITCLSGNGIPKLKNFYMYAADKDTSDGKMLYPNNSWYWSKDPGSYLYNGINAWTQIEISSVNVSGFSGNGLFIFGDPTTHLPSLPRVFSGSVRYPSNGNGLFVDLDEPADRGKLGYSSSVIFGPLDTARVAGFGGAADIDFNDPGSAFKIRIPAGHYDSLVVYTIGPGLIADNIQINGLNNFDFNSGCGVYVAGADGNQSTAIGLSVRENGLWGVNDNSFLGAFWIGTHASANGHHFNFYGLNNEFGHDSLTMGGFATTNQNSQSVWLGCYTEQNMGPEAEHLPNALIIAGLKGPGVTSGSYLRAGGWSSANIGGVGLTDNVVAYQLSNDNKLKTGGNSSNGNYYDPTFNSSIYSMRVTGPSGNEYTNNRGIFELKSDGQIQMKNFHAIDLFQIRNRLYGITVDSPSQISTNGVTSTIVAGTETINKNYNGSNPPSWICSQSGTYNSFVGIARRNNGPTIEVDSTGFPFKGGEYIKINGITYLLTNGPSLGGIAGSYSFYVSPTPPNINNGDVVTASEPKYKAQGYGSGTTGQRPTLTTDDIGWKYYDTTLGQWLTWTGSSFEVK